MNRRRWIAAAVVTVASAAIGGTAFLISRHEFFEIRAIEFHGLRYIDENDLALRLGVPERARVTLDLAPIAAAAAGLPGVRDVTVERRWPGTLVVTVVEARPVAIAPVGQELQAIDDRGVVLPYPPARVAESLPLAPRDSATAALLARLASVDPEGYAGVEQATRAGGVVTLHGEGRVVHLRPDADVGVLRDLAAVRSRLAVEGIGWREMDARYRDRVFVRRGSA